MGIVGAGITSVLAQVLVAALNWYFLGAKIQRPNLLKLLWRIYLSAGLMWLAVWSTRQYLNLWQLIGLGVVSYVTFMLVLGGIQPGDREILRRLLQGLRKNGKTA
jgi:hypothetical protein